MPDSTRENAHVSHATSPARHGRGRWLSEDHDLAGPDGEYEIDATDDGARSWYHAETSPSWARTLFWALLGPIAFGIVAIFVSIPGSTLICAVAGLGIFGAFTIFDFNRLRRSTPDAAVPIAAAIFPDARSTASTAYAAG